MELMNKPCFIDRMVGDDFNVYVFDDDGAELLCLPRSEWSNHQIKMMIPHLQRFYSIGLQHGQDIQRQKIKEALGLD
jgi:hypothetical protein